jgi:hypothetical protein
MQNIVEMGMLPVEAIGDMASMYKKGELYEVMVEDRMNPDAKYFSFGLNGRLGEYPTNAKIRLRGEEIQHLYNCTYESPIVQESANDFRRVVGKRVVCRFAITPTKWGAIPSDGVVLDARGVSAKPAATLPFFAQNDEQDKDEQAAEQPAQAANGPAIDDMLAAREKELEAMTIPTLRDLSRDCGLKQNGNKTDLIEALLKYEEKKLRGEE